MQEGRNDKEKNDARPRDAVIHDFLPRKCVILYVYTGEDGKDLIKRPRQLRSHVCDGSLYGPCNTRIAPKQQVPRASDLLTIA